MVHKTQNVTHMVAEHGWTTALSRSEASSEILVTTQLQQSHEHRPKQEQEPEPERETEQEREKEETRTEAAAHIKQHSQTVQNTVEVPSDSVY